MKSSWMVLGVAAWAMCGCSDDGGAAASPGTEPPAGFADICAGPGVVCDGGDSPPSLVGNYSGQGATVVTTNELWSAGSTQTFTAQIAQQSAGQVTGSIDMDSFHLDVNAAELRGDATSFTIYGVDAVDREGCSLEARVLISGTASDSGDAAALAGDLVLTFTDRIQGSGCTAEQIGNYPGTGARFEYTASRVP